MQWCINVRKWISIESISEAIAWVNLLFKHSLVRWHLLPLHCVTVVIYYALLLRRSGSPWLGLHSNLLDAQPSPCLLIFTLNTAPNEQTYYLSNYTPPLATRIPTQPPHKAIDLFEHQQVAPSCRIWGVTSPLEKWLKLQPVEGSMTLIKNLLYPSTEFACFSQRGGLLSCVWHQCGTWAALTESVYTNRSLSIPMSHLYEEPEYISVSFESSPGRKRKLTVDERTIKK